MKISRLFTIAITSISFSYSLATFAQPALSQLPQANAPAISEQIKQAIARQFTPQSATLSALNQTQMQPALPQNLPAALVAARTNPAIDDQANQKAFIAEIQQNLMQRLQSR